MSRHARRAGAVILATLTIASIAAGPAAAAFAGGNGRTTFMRFDSDGGRSQEEDGTGSRIGGTSAVARPLDAAGSLLLDAFETAR
jgi:hypothetical protein